MRNGAALFLVASAACTPHVDPPLGAPEPTPASAIARPAPRPSAEEHPSRPAPRELAGRPVVLRDVGLAVLFRDEVAQLNEAARRALEGAGLHPIAASEQAKLEAIAASGRLVDGGPVCAIGPTAEDALYAAHPDLTHAELDLDCMFRRCSIGLAVYTTRLRKHGSESGAPVVRVSANVAAPLDVTSWEGALAASPLEPVTPSRGTGGGEGIGTLGFGSTRPGWLIGVVTALGAFTQPPPSHAFDAEERALSACPRPPPFTLPTMLLGVGADGAVERCEVEPAGPLERCACGVVGAHRFEPASGKRRVRLDLSPGCRPAAAFRPAPAERIGAFARSPLERWPRLGRARDTVRRGARRQRAPEREPRRLLRARPRRAARAASPGRARSPLRSRAHPRRSRPGRARRVRQRRLDGRQGARLRREGLPRVHVPVPAPAVVSDEDGCIPVRALKHASRPAARVDPLRSS